MKPEDEYKETMESIRHYSRLRFAQLVVFSGLNAAMIFTAFRSPATPLDSSILTIVAVAGIAFSLLFFWMEVVHDLYKSYFIKVAIELSPNGHWSRRPKYLAILVRIPVWSVYIIPFVFWIFMVMRG